MTFGHNISEAIEMAQDAVEQYLLACEDLGLDPATPSEVGRITVAENELLFLVDGWMPLLRDKENNKAVKNH